MRESLKKLLDFITEASIKKYTGTLEINISQGTVTGAWFRKKLKMK